MPKTKSGAFARTKSASTTAEESQEDATGISESILTVREEDFSPVCSAFPAELGNLYAYPMVESLPPGGQRVLYYSGPSNARVVITVSRVPNTGGHYHAGGPAGSVSSSSFVLGPKYPQNVPVVFTAPIASGTIVQTGRWSIGTPPTLSANWNVAVPGLIPLTSGPGIVLVGSSNTHPQNHNGTPNLVRKLTQLGGMFYRDTGKNLFINDMSLHDGGLYDFKNTWAPPHVTHREGRTADINSTMMSSIEKDVFRTLARSLGFSVTLEANPEHWHIYI